MPEPIRIAAAIILNADNETLLVRKQGATAFMQPGGKIDAGETAPVALCRELEEELGVVISPDDFSHVGRFDAPAANEPGQIVDAEIYLVRHNGPFERRAEIAETIWYSQDLQSGPELAPLTRDHVLPIIATQGCDRA